MDIEELQRDLEGALEKMDAPHEDFRYCLNCREVRTASDCSDDHTFLWEGFYPSDISGAIELLNYINNES